MVMHSKFQQLTAEVHETHAVAGQLNFQLPAVSNANMSALRNSGGILGHFVVMDI
jgi:hypothetical protein